MQATDVGKLEPRSRAQLWTEVTRPLRPGSMLVNSNRLVAEWSGVFGDPVVAVAILDRPLHHSRVITIRGDGDRLRTKVGWPG